MGECTDVASAKRAVRGVRRSMESLEVLRRPRVVVVTLVSLAAILTESQKAHEGVDRAHGTETREDRR